jgi:hypothetical protein
MNLLSSISRNILHILFVVIAVSSMKTAEATAELAGCPLFPEDNVWNTPVDTLPVDARSSSYVTTIGASKSLHPDFGSGTWNGGPIGIPYTIVPGTQPEVPVTLGYADESDPGPYPIPPYAAIEGGSESDGDRHVLVLDQDNCMLYETWSTYPQPGGSWEAGSGAIFDLRSNALRPATWTSADAAGLPILPGLIRYDEVASGEIHHAIRFTAPQTRREFIWPARHYASSLTSTQYPPMGQRFRLKADFDISSFSPEVQVILLALKRYGMILADNGSSWFISGAPDPGWNNDVLVNEFRRVTGSNFEAVDESSLMISPDSGRARQSDTPEHYTLTIQKQGSGTGSVTSTDGTIHCSPDCSETYAEVTIITLTAAPDNGSEFTGWTGCIPSQGDPKQCSVTMNEHITVAALFQNEAFPPTGSIVINGGAEAAKSTSAILTLTATDNSGGPIQMCISNTTSCSAWISFAATKSWTLSYGNGIKTVYVWFKDKWGNTNPAPYSDAIFIDITAPNNGTVTGTPGNAQVTLNWSGFSDALSGVGSYKVVYNTGGNPPYSCSGGTAVYTGTDTSFIHTGRTNGTTYSYRVCAIDKAGNMSSGATISVKPVPETNPPTGSIVINSGAEAAKTTSTILTLTATDDSGNPIRMCISNTTSCSAWISFTATKNWKLPYGNGVKTIYVWFRDKWGNTNPVPYSDTIFIDTTAPVNGTASGTPGDTQVTLNWSGFSDALSGIGSYKVVYAAGSTPPYSCSSGTAVYSGTEISFIHSGRANGTAYAYRVCAIDKAGNMSSGATARAKPAGP